MTGLVQAVSRLGLSPGAVVAAAAAALVLLVLLGWLLRRRRASPSERERRRRLAVHTKGRICDGNVVDYRDGALYYTYSVGGLEYTASQEVSTLGEWLPPDPSAAIGPGSVKYLRRNPADSIVLCEHWSGLRVRPRPART